MIKLHLMALPMKLRIGKSLAFQLPKLKFESSTAVEALTKIYQTIDRGGKIYSIPFSSLYTLTLWDDDNS